MVKELFHSEYESVHDSLIIDRLNELIREHNKKIGKEDET